MLRNLLLAFTILSVMSSTNQALANKDKLYAPADLAKKVKGLEFVKSYGGINEYKLKNGLKILLKSEKAAPIIAWQVWYKVGSRNESNTLTGLAHYLEHMMFKGTKTFDKGEIAQIIQLRGGIFNAFTGDDYTAYFENFSPEHLELAIKIEADRMRNSRLAQEEIETERSVIVSELEGGENNPNNILYKNLKAAAYDVHPYKNPIIGWKKDLYNINHENMKAFYETFYAPNNAVAVLVGNFEEQLALELIEKYFGDYKAAEHKLPAISEEPKQASFKKVIINKEGYVKLLANAYHIPKFDHEDTAALHIISDVAFGGTSSRLFKKLVDTGLVTNISGHAEANVDPGLFRVIAAINPDEDITKVEKIIDAELEAIKSGITEDELRRAKARVEASSIYERDGAYNEALQIGYFEGISKWETYVDWVDMVNAVSIDDIKKVAKKYFVKTNKTSVELIPEAASESLVSDSSIGLTVNDQLVQAYGAATVDKLDPEKLKKLLKLSEAKYSKNSSAYELNLELKNIALGKDFDSVKVIHKEDHNLPLVYMDTVLFAGSINDNDKLGLAYMTAEMLERGTKQRDKFQISELLDLYGSEISISNKKETAEIEVSSIKKNLDQTLEILTEMLKEPLFSEKELEKLKVEAIASVKQEDEYLRNITARELKRVIYPEDHPYYAHTPEEKIKAIEKITIDDIKAFYKKHYNTKNLIISIVGDITEEEVKTKLKELFSDWNSDTKDPKNDRPEVKLVTAKKPTEKTIIKDDKSQTEVLMGHSTEISRMHKDFYPLLLANYALGGSALSSRLGTKVRDEHGLVYDVRSGFKASLGAGSFTVSLGCNPNNTEKAIKIAKEVITEFLKEGISETELEATKSYIAGSFAARNLSSNEDIAGTLAFMEVYQLGSGYVENYSKLINAISLEEVNEAARKHIKPELLNVIIAGPSTKN